MQATDLGMMFFVATPVVLLTIFAALFIGSYEQSQRDFIG